MEEPMDCAQAQARMTEQISTRLGQVQAELDAVFAEQAAAGGVGAADTGPLRRSIPLAQEGGRLRAAADVLTAPPEPGGCTDECTCSRAAAVTGGAYVFTPGAVTPQGRPIVCTLDGDGGDMAGRIGEWQAVLAQATGHQEIAEGIAVTFPHDIARTAELARLLAAEYSCCSFASYHLTIDGDGVRMEVHTPPEAHGALAAVFGTA